MNIPKYINQGSNIVRLVGFTALFALIFINIYKPFESSSWYPISKFMFFVYSSIIILTGVLVVIISRIIMYLTTRKRGISYIGYGIWVLGEILFMSLFYTMYTIIVKRGLDPMDVFKDSIINTALVILLPYGVLTLYFAWADSKKRLAKLENGEVSDTEKSKIVSFKDEKGVLRISISSENILYIESSDNYVIIHYENLGKHKKYLLRNTLKNIENELSKSSILRCHRSYLVNFSRVKVLRRTKEGLVLELDADNLPELPVSKSYQASVSQKMFGEIPDNK
jgi:hypothetical protein